MILSVSRRTDIPAFYTPWFMNRLREGFVLVRNPMNYHQVSRVSLSPSVIDCIVFWTKNGAPLLPYLESISASYPFYFQYTLNAYHSEIEPGLKTLDSRISAFQSISKQIGANRIIWRYDPILFSDKYPLEWHIDRFSYILEKLCGFTRECVFSFIDLYEKVKTNIKGLNIRECSPEEIDQISSSFSTIANKRGLRLRTCAEAVDLEKYGIAHGCCVDGKLISELTGWNMSAKKDPNQRQECGCLESIDIGQYNTCRHGCKYCYANFNQQSVITFSKKHDPHSPFLIGNIEPDDKVTERKMKSLKKEPSGQISMF